MAYLEKAARQGHAYAMSTLGGFRNQREEHQLAVGWFTMAAEAGLPQAQFNLGTYLDKGEGVAAPDYPAAADWFRRAADAGDAGVGEVASRFSGMAASNLSGMYSMGRGVTRSKRQAMRWTRKAAEYGHAESCTTLAQWQGLTLVLF